LLYMHVLYMCSWTHISVNSFFLNFFPEVSSGSEEVEIDEDGVFRRKGWTS